MMFEEETRYRVADLEARVTKLEQDIEALVETLALLHILVMRQGMEIHGKDR